MTTLNKPSMIKSWQGRPVVVTGASGFIGSHLVDRLVQEGARVRALVHYNSRGDLGNLRFLAPQIQSELEIVTGDIRDARTVAQLIRGSSVVFHLAALIGIPYSYLSPGDVVATNVLGSLNVLEAARDATIDRLVHTSTSETYGTAKYAPIDEKHPLQGQSPYSASKIGADKLVESYVLSFGVPAVTVRPFNTFGPRQSARAVIPTIITQALCRDSLTLGSLEPKRDFTFVRDTVEGFLCCASSERCIGEVVNVGTGVDVSVGQIVGQIREILGRPLPVQCDASRVRPDKSEVMRLICDNQKAAVAAGWTPKLSLAVGLKETVEWISEHLDLYSVDSYAI